MEPEHDNLENTNLDVNDETLAQADDDEIPRIPQDRQVGKSQKQKQGAKTRLHRQIIALIICQTKSAGK